MSESINYPAELERIAREIRRNSVGNDTHFGDSCTLREAASELARLALSEATLRDHLTRAACEVEELYEELDGFRHPHSRATGRAGDPS